MTEGRNERKKTMRTESKTTADGHTLQIIYGDFREGEVCIFNIDGKIIRRKVCSTRKHGDLYIRVNGRDFLFCEFI